MIDFAFTCSMCCDVTAVMWFPARHACVFIEIRWPQPFILKSSVSVFIHCIGSSFTCRDHVFHDLALGSALGCTRPLSFHVSWSSCQLMNICHFQFINRGPFSDHLFDDHPHKGSLVWVFFLRSPGCLPCDARWVSYGGKLQHCGDDHPNGGTFPGMASASG